MATYKSRVTAIKTLRGYFGNAPGSDSVTKQAIFDGLGKNLDDKKAVSLFSNRLSLLRHYGFIYTDYATDGSHRVTGISLTDEGRKALGRVGETAETEAVSPANTPPTVTNENSETQRIITPETVYADIKVLRRQNPSFRVGLIFEPKEEPANR